MRRLLFHPLAWLTDPVLADSIIGDLDELRARRARRSNAGATLWFWRAALGILVHVIGVRVREALAAMLTSKGSGRGAGADVRDALRAFRRTPGFALAAVLLLALGIGANTVVFSVVHSVMLRPLPYADPDRLVYLWGGPGTHSGNRHRILTGTQVHEIARRESSFESHAVTKPWDTAIDGVVDLVREDGADRLRGAFVTANFFELLGVSARLGRTFTAPDSDGAPIAVISSGLWKRRFQADSHVIGQQVRLAGGRTSRTQPPYTIVGVLPEEVRFTYPRETEIYLLLPWSEIGAHGALEYTMIARLRRGVLPSQAELEVTSALRNVIRDYTNISREALPAVLERTRAFVEPMPHHVAAEVRPGLLLLTGAAALVLLIACINLGLLTLARTIDRTTELAVRSALGAGPARLLRLLAVEGLALAVAGGAVGVGLAAALLPWVQWALPAIVPRADQISINVPVLLVAAMATAASAIVCGITPALVAVRGDLLGSIRRSGSTATDSRRALAWRGAIVGVQVGIVLVLLVGAGLLLHSFWRMQHVQLGFDAEDVLTFETRLYNPKYRSRQRLRAFETELLDHVRQIPGVENATISTAVPMRGVDFTRVIGPVDGEPKPGRMRSVDPDYFHVMKIPLRGGRLFTADDAAHAPPVMIVSESFARLHFGSDGPIGRSMDLGESPAEIVGVVGDVRYAEVVRDPEPAFYVPRAQSPGELICLLVRARPGMETSVADALRTGVRALDPEQPAEGLTTIGEIVSSSTADRRLYAVASGAFAILALVLAMAGLFGVVSRAVTERRRELAIRAALGAGRHRLARLVLAGGLVPVAVGAGAGLAAAIAASRVLRAFLFEVQPTDPLTYGVAVAMVLVVAALACVRPTLIAMRLQPMEILRNDF